MDTTTHTPFVIGICGPSCSGKTTASEKIIEKLQEGGEDKAVLISQDQYYISGDADKNYDVPEALEFSRLVSDLKKLKAGKSIQAPQYDFSTHSRMEETIELKSAPIIIVEGILIFCNPELRELLDLKVFVQATAELYFQRRVYRDVAQRGRNRDLVTKRYMSHVVPSNAIYVIPSSNHADIILQNNIEHKFIGLDMMILCFEVKLEQQIKLDEQTNSSSRLR